MHRHKYLWYSDTHLNLAFPWTQRLFAENILDEKPHGVFLTGDIACGISLISILDVLARKLSPLPIYFILGNHDFFGSSFAKITDKLQNLQSKHSNLIWMSDKEPIHLNADFGLIGVDGWYDLKYHSDPKRRQIFLNLDWLMIEDFQKLPNIVAKQQLSRQLADASTTILKVKLLKALEAFKTVYILTHVPPYKEATHYCDDQLNHYWRPYNANTGMAKMIEEVMKDHPNQNVILLAGHTHQHSILNISHNIECIVGEGKYLGDPKHHQQIVI